MNPYPKFTAGRCLVLAGLLSLPGAASAQASLSCSGSGDINCVFAGSVIAPNPSSQARASLSGTSLPGSGDRLTLRMDATVVFRSPGEPNFDLQTEQFVNLARLSTVDLSGFVTSSIAVAAFNRWELQGVDQLSGSDSEVHLEGDGWLHTAQNRFGDVLATLDFGGGNNLLRVDGAIGVGAGTQTVGTGALPLDFRQRAQAEIRLSQLTRLENAGDLYLGVAYRYIQRASAGAVPGIKEQTVRSTDLWNDDILSAEGTAYQGLPGSRLFVDTDLGGRQGGCDASLRDADTGFLPASDCLNLKGGSTEGQTAVVVHDIYGGERGAFNREGIVIVDVAGGSSGAGHFVLSPESSSYSPAHGGVIDKGIFIFPLAYDPDTQQHKLYGVVGGTGWQMPLLAHGAQQLWRQGSGSLFGRQSDIREALAAGQPQVGNAWARLESGSGDRQARPVSRGGGAVFTFNNDYTQEVFNLSLGRDFVIGGTAERRWLLGGMAGYGSVDYRFDDSPNDINLEGMLAGAYASLLTPTWFIDSVLSVNVLTADADVPGLDLQPDSAILNTDITTYGLRMEAGWRGLQRGRLALEPLLGLAWVVSDLDDLRVAADDTDPNVQGVDVRYDTATSLRGSLGLRLAAERLSWLVPRTDVALQLRYAHEFDGEAAAALENQGAETPMVASTLDGGFIEVESSATLASQDGRMAVLLGLAGTFSDEFDSINATAGFRYRW